MFSLHECFQIKVTRCGYSLILAIFGVKWLLFFWQFLNKCWSFWTFQNIFDLYLLFGYFEKSHLVTLCATFYAEHGPRAHIKADPDGRVEFRFSDRLVKVYDIIGRSIVVSSDPDDLGRGTSPLSLASVVFL